MNVLNGLRRLIKTPISAGNTAKVEIALLLIGLLMSLLVISLVRCSGAVPQSVQVEGPPR